jgi:hypothetical protein
MNVSNTIPSKPTKPVVPGWFAKIKERYPQARIEPDGSVSISGKREYWKPEKEGSVINGRYSGFLDTPHEGKIIHSPTIECDDGSVLVLPAQMVLVKFFDGLPIGLTVELTYTGKAAKSKAGQSPASLYDFRIIG